MSLFSLRSVLTSAAVLACAVFAASESHAATRLLPQTRCDSGQASCDITYVPPPPAEPQIINGGVYWNCYVNSSGWEICRPEFLVWYCDEDMVHCFRLPAPSTCTSATCPFFDVPVADRKPLVIHDNWVCGLEDGDYASCDLALRVCYEDGTCFKY